MQIICVSKGTFTGGKSLAEKLAEKLGYDCVSREELTDAATRAGIPVGKLEMAIINGRPLSERLAIEKERFKAFLAATLCERAARNNVVYHGRTGHLFLPGITQVLRVRVIWDNEQRLASVMERLGLTREKAQKYIEGVDEDRRRWIRALYNIDWQDPSHYDAVVNLSHMSVDNAAASLIPLTQLPEFQITPATRRMLEDLLIASRCRLAIGSDQRTAELNVQVRSESGRVSVTYLPRQKREAAFIPDVLKNIEGVEEILCTMATTNLLWIQERFDPQGGTLPEILDIAAKWNAAVELVQMSERAETATAVPEPGAAPAATERPQETGGILDDTPEEEEALQDEGLRQTRDRLIAAGRAGGYRLVPTGTKTLLDSLDRTTPYSLVVVGDLYLSKPASVQKRLCREMIGFLSDNLRVPVIGTDELKTKYLFGSAQWLRLLGTGVIAFILFFALITHQKELLEFIVAEGHGGRILGTIAMLVFVPVFANMYGAFTRYLLRLVRFE